jgi:hypothetical protein
MFDRILKRMPGLVRARKYVLTVHAENEMDADGLTIYDVESIVLTGRIVERQRDRALVGRKYLIGGRSLDGDPATVVAKIGPMGKLVFITVFKE